MRETLTTFWTYLTYMLQIFLMHVLNFKYLFCERNSYHILDILEIHASNLSHARFKHALPVHISLVKETVATFWTIVILCTQMHC